MKVLAAALTLMVLSALLPEVGTGNTPILKFLAPTPFLFLVVIGYGLPVLLIRELAVRRHLGIAGLIVAGFAYGSYNEGLWARTLINTANEPISTFNGYGDVLGIAIPWALLICLYHAVASVGFPILLTHALYPDEASRPWLDWRFALALGAALLAFAAFAFLQPRIPHGTILQLVVFTGVIVAGMVVAAGLGKVDRPPAQASTPASVLAVALGLSTLTPFVALSVLAHFEAPLALFIIAWLAIVAAYAAVMQARGWQWPPNIALFALGFYMQSIFMALLLELTQPQHRIVSQILAGVTLEVAFIWGAVTIIRAARQTSEPAAHAYPGA